MADSGKYQLNDTLYGHTADVRTLAVSLDGQIVSGSRDLSARVWIAESSKFAHAAAYTCHSNFVSSVCFLPPSPQHPAGVVVTGSNDKQIRLFEPNVTSPFKILKSHTNTVCKLVSGTFGWSLLSASWDQTALGWREEGSDWVSATFSGHTAAVWSVCQLTSGLVVTASADKTLRVFGESGDYQRALSGHTDCVRDVAAAGTDEVLSVANDASVRHWHVLSGECLNTYYGHGHYIYSIAMLPGVGWVTSSEDRTVKVWTQTGEVDSISLPSASVWDVAVLPNSDIVAGTNDGMIRIFTKDPARVADASTLATYEEQVSKFSASASEEIGGVKLAELPGKEALFEPGRTDGQTKLVREGNKAVAYAWSMEEGSWQQIGDVVGASGSGAGETGRPVHNGKEYDYVFNVDIEDGKPALKLPFNRTEDPWVAAQKFIHDQDLPQSYLEQVANFIVTNSGVTAPVAVQPDFVDPFTGGSRYVPLSSATNGTAQQSRRNSTQPTRYFPQRDFLRFDQANISAIKDKILLLNRDHGLGVEEGEISVLLEKCEASAVCSATDLALLDRLLQWPADLVFPVLDVMRLVIRQPAASTHLCTDQLLSRLQTFLQIHPNNMLVLRICSNMISTPAGEALAAKHRLKLIEFVLSIPSPYSKFIQVALATLLLNIAVLLRRSTTSEGREEALLASRELLPSFVDQEAVFRGLVALGTMLTNCTDRVHIIQPFLPLLIQHSADAVPRIRECANEVLALNQS